MIAGLDRHDSPIRGSLRNSNDHSLQFTPSAEVMTIRGRLCIALFRGSGLQVEIFDEHHLIPLLVVEHLIDESLCQ